MNELMNEWMNEWMRGQVGECMDEWMDECVAAGPLSYVPADFPRIGSGDTL